MNRSVEENTDPRRPGGDILEGSQRDNKAVTLDMTDGVLLDKVDIALVEPEIGGELTGYLNVAMTLGGRINKTEERSKILYLFDADVAAEILTELIALASREEFGHELNALIDDRIRSLGYDGPS